jgi:hypothetical protein
MALHDSGSLLPRGEGSLTRTYASRTGCGSLALFGVALFRRIAVDRGSQDAGARAPSGPAVLGWDTAKLDWDPCPTAGVGCATPWWPGRPRLGCHTGLESTWWPSRPRLGCLAQLEAWPHSRGGWATTRRSRSGSDATGRWVGSDPAAGSGGVGRKRARGRLRPTQAQGEAIQGCDSPPGWVVSSRVTPTPLTHPLQGRPLPQGEKWLHLRRFRHAAPQSCTVSNWKLPGDWVADHAEQRCIGVLRSSNSEGCFVDVSVGPGHAMAHHPHPQSAHP